jgi:hypothetical protein
MSKKDLKSSVAQKGDVVDQYILFSNGNEKTYRGVKTESISQSQFTRFELVDGTRVYVNTRNVDAFEVHPSEKVRTLFEDINVLEEKEKA